MRQLIERMSIECCHTKTKLITTTAYRNKESHKKEPIRTSKSPEARENAEDQIANGLSIETVRVSGPQSEVKEN